MLSTCQENLYLVTVKEQDSLSRLALLRHNPVTPLQS